MAIGLAALIGMVALVEAGVNGMDSGKDGNEPFHGKWSRMKQAIHNRWHSPHGKNGRWNNAWEHAARNMLNVTRLEGVLENINGTYYVEGTPLYLGNEMFLNTLARSDYDGDEKYEQVYQEIEGLEGSNVVVNGVLRNGTLYVSHINGIWLRMPRSVEISEVEGILENINGSYFVDDYKIIIKRGFSRSDIDGDGSLERMYDELAGLEGSNITVDGVIHDGYITVMHINGIWAR